VEQIFFGGWSSLIRTLIVGVLAYVVLVIFLRISGNRTLSKLNAFDLIVTVALGSTLATVLLSKSVPLADGVLAFSLLIGLQLVVTCTSIRIRWLRRILTGEPQLLLYRGEFMPASLRKARVVCSTGSSSPPRPVIWTFWMTRSLATSGKCWKTSGSTRANFGSTRWSPRSGAARPCSRPGIRRWHGRFKGAGRTISEGFSGSHFHC